MSVDLHQKDVHEFFSFINSEGHTFESVVWWYLDFHGLLNWGQQGVIFDQIKSLLGPAGANLTRTDVLGANAELTRAILEKISPAVAGSYYTPVPAPATKTELLAESDNEWCSSTLPAPVNMRLRLPRRPAWNLYEVTGHSLFIAPYGYQAFDPDAGTYWPTVSSRAFARSISKYPTHSVSSPVIIIQDVYDGGNFSHFLFDWIPRLLAFVEARPDLAREGKFIFGGEQKPFQTEVLRRISERVKIPLENFVFPTERAIMKLKGPLFYFSDQREFMTHPLNMCHPTTVKNVKALFNDIPKTRVSLPNVYISRRDAPMRKIINESEIIAALRGLGYVDICLSDLSALDQMSLFQDAKSIVAPHGMGLTHLLFSNGDAELLELFNPEVGSDAYAFVARALGIRYGFLFGEAKNDNYANYEIDVGRMLIELEKLKI